MMNNISISTDRTLPPVNGHHVLNGKHQYQYSAGEEKFPITLFKILQDYRFDNVIAWTPDGAAFTIHNKKALEEQVVPQYFKNHIYYRSFLRKLYRWGFAKRFRTTADSERKRFAGEGHTYFHQAFRRDRPDLCFAINCSADSTSRHQKTNFIPPTNRNHSNAPSRGITSARDGGFTLILDSDVSDLSTAPAPANISRASAFGPPRSFLHHATDAYHNFTPTTSMPFTASTQHAGGAGYQHLACSSMPLSSMGAAPSRSSSSGGPPAARHQYGLNLMAQELSLLNMIATGGYHDVERTRTPQEVHEYTTRKIRQAHMAQSQQTHANNCHQLATLNDVLHALQGQASNQVSLLAEREGGDRTAPMQPMMQQQPHL